MAGLLDFLRGPQSQMPGQQAQMNPFQRLLQPEVALPMAAALLGNQGNAANFGNAFGAAGQALGQQKLLQAQTAEKNKTIELLRRDAPDIAQAIEGGLSVGDGWKAYMQRREAKTSGLINAGDGNIYDPQNKSWIQAPGGGAKKAPQVVEIFDEASGQPYKATWNQETGSYERVGGVKARSGMMLKTNPDGTVEMVQGDMSKAPKLNEAEGRNSGFYGRGVKSHEILKQLEGEGTSLYNNTVGKLPVVGNYAVTEKAQMYDQAKRDFVNAVLRRESGAVISPEEFRNAEQQYFPQPGDGPEVIAQKRVNRETTIRGLEISSGQGAAMATQPPSGMSGATPGAVIDYRDFFGGQ